MEDLRTCWSQSWGNQKGGLVPLRFVVFLKFPYINMCFLLWDSVLELIYEIDEN